MARCEMCETSHEGGIQHCPEHRTGETLSGKYEIGQLLGCGGIAAVYAAHHRLLGRDIALKVMHKRFAADEELGARFVREARETAGMGHPAFVAVHNAGTTEDGCAFIEMDRLDGVDLYTIRKQEGTISPGRTVQIAIEVLAGLQALHDRGVIHRDLKSSNIFLVVGPSGEDQVKLLDLGFAKVEDDLGKLTTRNQLLGTPLYISPEQAADPTSVDARADVFSLGVVMYEILTGKWPYTFTSKGDLLPKVLKGDVERHPAKARPDLAGWLDLIVAKAMQHDKAKRYESAGEMREALEGARRNTSKPTRPNFLKRLLGRE
ncbi:MAG TPA: serine/threonine-protein kinase [Kofleriaceae bacterium]|jgi:serine/threonine-protein kinase